MNDNKLKIMLGEKYTENPIINFLLYLQEGKDTLPTPQNLFRKEYVELTYNERIIYQSAKDKWRKKYDLDVIHLNGDLYADTIFSIWMPLKMCLQTSATYPYSDFGNTEKPYKSKPYIPNIIKNIDTYLPYNEWQELYKFVNVALTDANVMKLPEKNIQGRGKFYDQMPKTLYECFEGGVFHWCFKDIKVEEWVKEQNLTMFFEGNISKENIKPLIKRIKVSDFQWIKNREELREMLTNYYTIFKIRISS